MTPFARDNRYKAGWLTQAFFEGGPCILPSATMIRRSIRNDSYFDEALTTAQDNDVYLRLSVKTPFVVVSLDLERIMWTHTKAFRQDYFVPDGGTLLPTLGGPDGPGFGWNDQSVIKLGVGWDVNDCLTLRLGLNYGDRPMGGFDTRLNALTQQTIDTHITGGFTWYLPCCGELTMNYIHGFASTLRGDRPSDNDTLVFDLRNKEDSVGISYGRTF